MNLAATPHAKLFWELATRLAEGKREGAKAESGNNGKRGCCWACCGCAIEGCEVGVIMGLSDNKRYHLSSAGELQRPGGKIKRLGSATTAMRW